MTLDELIAMARARLEHLARTRETAVRLGDTMQLSQIDTETTQTQATLNLLLTLVT